MQACHDGHIDIARTAATAFGKQHHWQLVFERQAQKAVGFLVVAHALRACKNRRVIGKNGAALPSNAANACHHPIGWGIAHQIVGCATLALCSNGQRTVFRKAVRVTQVSDVFSRSAKPQRVAFGHHFGTVGV